jgi:hypothetical protein
VRRSSVLVVLALALLPATARAGVVTPGGFSTAGQPAKESTYLGIGPWGYEPYFPTVSAHQASGAGVSFGDGYAAAPSYEELAPGSCFRPQPNQVECGLAPAGGEPFTITGTEGEDVFAEITCVARDGAPCPRALRIALGAGNDALRFWTFQDSPEGPQDPMTGMHDWVAVLRTPTNGVQISMGAGADTITLMGGPSTGVIDAGAGDDRIFTQGGFSEAHEPVTGGYEIRCGSGWDIVQPGPGDRVGRDCERILASASIPDDDEADAASVPADIAATCGTARFTFHDVTRRPMAVREGKRGCVYLVSNRFARDLLQLAYRSDDDLSAAFVRVLDTARKAARAGGSSPDRDALEAYVRDAMKIPDGQDVLIRALPWWVQDAVETAGKADPLALIGGAVGSLAIPLNALVRIDQIEQKGACLQFTTGVRHGRFTVESRLIYSPLHYSDPSGSVARVYRPSGEHRRRDLNLACGADGMVHTDVKRDTKRIFASARTTRGRAR